MIVQPPFEILLSELYELLCELLLDCIRVGSRPLFPWATASSQVGVAPLISAWNVSLGSVPGSSRDSLVFNFLDHAEV